MEEQKIQPREPIKKSTTAFMAVLGVIITAIIVGGGVYWWQMNKGQQALKNTINQKQAEFQQQINECQSQVDQLKSDKEKLEQIILEDAQSSSKITYSNKI